ncbi:MAG: hypothetical protein AAGF20_06390 [Pseudomonadota bacterium]
MDESADSQNDHNRSLRRFATLGGIAAVLGIIGFIVDLPSRFSSDTPISRDDMEREMSDLRAETQRMQDTLDKILAATSNGSAATESGLDELRVAAARRTLMEDPDAAQDLAEGRISDGLTGLEVAASAKDSEAAQAWRDIGALAFYSAPSRALNAYRQATRLDATDFWSWIYLSNLESRVGANLASATGAAQQAVDMAADDRERMIALGFLGSAKISKGELAEAELAYKQALVVAERQLEADPDLLVYYYDKMNVLDNLGYLAVSREAINEALDYRADSLTMARVIDDTEGATPDSQNNLSIHLEQVGSLALEADAYPQAEQYLLEARRISEPLVAANPDRSDFARQLWVVVMGLGDLQLAQDQTGEAYEIYEKALQMAQGYMRLDPSNAEAQRDVAVVSHRLGLVALDLGRDDIAATMFADVIDVIQDRAAQDPLDIAAQSDLLENRLLLAAATRDERLAQRSRTRIDELVQTGRLNPNLMTDLMDAVAICEARQLL